MKKSVLFIIIITFLSALVSCNNKDKLTDKRETVSHNGAKQVYEYLNQFTQKRQDAVCEYLNKMTLEEKICQLFIENIDGSINYKPIEKITSENKDIEIIPGGYLFFAFNLAPSSEKIIEFTNSIYEYTSKNKLVPPFLAIDHEGGPVNRLKQINAPLISCDDMAKKYSPEESKKYYELQALQMKNLGFTMNLAPVVEICTEANKDFLSGRSFGSENDVTVYSTNCVEAYENNGISTVIKHFPGNTNTDPHLGLPVINMSKEEIMNTLKPFIQVLNINPDGILMSHAIVPSVDNLPSCLSGKWVTQILRNELNYQGIIFSDDIFMAALLKNGYPPEKAVVMAIEAGIDCIMISGKFISEPVSILSKKYTEDKNFAEKIDTAVNRMIKYKLQSGLLQYSLNDDGTYTVITAGNKKTKEQMQNDFIASKNENLNFIKKNEK